MTILHTQCLPTELAKAPNQSVIAATFNDCAGNPLLPADKLAKCSDIPAAQTLSIVGHTVSLSGGGGSVTVPDADAQTLSISGNNITISNGNTIALPVTAAPAAQVLSIVGHTVSLSGGGGSVVVPDLDAQTLSISGNVISLTNGGSVTLPAAAAQDPYATPAQAIAGTATALIVNPADLVARENIPAQTGVSNNPASVPAPAANQSPWAVNALGETLHYAPGLGWQIVNNRYGQQTVNPAVVPISANTWATAASFTMPRAGRIVVTGYQVVDNSAHNALASAIFVNATLVDASNADSVGIIGSASPFAGGAGSSTHNTSSQNGTVTWTGDVAAGDIVSLQGITLLSNGQIRAGARFSYTYIN